MSGASSASLPSVSAAACLCPFYYPTTTETHTLPVRPPRPAVGRPVRVGPHRAGSRHVPFERSSSI